MGTQMWLVAICVASSAALATAAWAQTIERISVDSAGTESNALSINPAISSDGRFVAFISSATNLVNGDTNHFVDIFVRDRDTGETSRVNLGPGGAEANDQSGLNGVSISGDGRFVAFASAASNLVDGDSNHVWDAFVADRATGAVTCVSVGQGGAQANGSSDFPAISTNGRFVAFTSVATNLVPADFNGSLDVFVHDRTTGQSSRASVDSTGAEVMGLSGGMVAAPSISSDGRFVAFQSISPLLVSGDTNTTWDIFVHDFVSGATTRVSVSTAGAEGDGPSLNPTISADGRYVVFDSFAASLVADDTNGAPDVFVHDRFTHETERMSVDSNGSQSNGVSLFASVTADGTGIGFYSRATNLVAGDSNDASDVFFHDRTTGQTTRLSVSALDSQGDADSGGSSRGPAFTPDGRLFAFDSLAGNLVPDDRNGAFDVFVRDRATLVLESIAPTTGSEAGDEIVEIRGSGFTAAPETTVSFGGRAALLVDVTSAFARVRTPPGTGAVNVVISNSNGAASVRSAYTYVGPLIAARFGNVNAGVGAREDVLLLDVTTGDPLTREVAFAVRQPVRITMLAPSSRTAPARFALWLWSGAPNASTVTSLPRGVGVLVMAPPFRGGQPRVTWNNAAHAGTLGSATLPSSPAPTIVLDDARGSNRRATVTLQGIIQDDGSIGSDHWSVTNAVVLRIR
ncbi:MAG: PD40 domain-containing protein [Planctomycetes bacterium]|nr:PD40 domain-containing protein [Planctomycetota bacterium]